VNPTSTVPADKRRIHETRLLNGALYVLAGLLIIAFSWQSRAGINPDGISYLDVCREILKGDHGAYFNPYWSPLFPALLAVVMKLSSPAPASILLLAHGVVAFSALAGLAAFVFFVMEWSHLLSRSRTCPTDQTGDFSRIAFGLALFLAAIIKFISTDILTPDTLVMTVVFAVAGLSCRLANRRGSTPSAICLGLLLAIGYLTKAALFPLGMLLIALLMLAWFRNRALMTRMIVASLVFLALTTPYIAELSERQHEITFGESAKLNYAWLVLQNSPAFAGWTHGLAISGTPAHPLVVLDTNPTVFEFENTAPGTLPVWYDPVYFYRGLKAPFDLRLQLKQLLRAPAQALRGTGKITLVVLFVLIFLAALARKQQLRSLKLAAPWLIAWGLGAYLMFGLVELLPRFVAPFFVILVLVGIDELFTRLPEGSVRLASLALFVGALSLISGLVFSRTLRRTVSAESDGRAQQQLADDLKRDGVLPNDKIAILGDPFNVYFAFEDQLQVVATIGFRGGGLHNDANSFWTMDAKSQRALEDRLAGLGVNAIVSSSACDPAAGPGWRDVGGHHDCALILKHDR